MSVERAHPCGSVRMVPMNGPAPVPDTEVTTGIDYVAMGDSFSAGPFIGTMRTDPQGCARSKDNYPAFLADWLDVASYTDVTCSAATTRDLYAPMVMFDGNTTGPQVDALSADAEVLVVGYPDILPTEGTCRAVGVPAEALAPVAEVADLLNASLRRGARAAGASYVDMAAVSDGHDVCAKGRAWINGPRFRAGVAAPFHPKINGMRAVATEVFRQVTGEDPEEITEYAEPDPDVVVLNEG